MNKSRPIYAPFRLDVSGRAHLIVTDQPALPDEVEVALANIELWIVKTIAPGVEAPAGAHGRAFRAKADLLSHLPHRLKREAVGLRLYAIGAEAFIWDVHNIAVAAGMPAAEIHLTRAGALTRRVYCSHCKTIGEAVATIHICEGCDAALFVRDHFSRRLAAFMGVKVDAEVPGEIPAPEAFAS
jgi:hypothetical protein